jgi:arginase
MAGDERHAASAGPSRLVEALRPILESRGAVLSTERIEIAAPFRDTASASALVNAKVRASVAAAIERDRLPLVFAGSCDVSLGVLAGLEFPPGVVWLDAHGDFNTPESTVSGFFAGMSLAIVTGHCYRDFWKAIGSSGAIAEEAVVLVGVRDLSPESERRRLERSKIRVVGCRDGRLDGDPLAALDELAKRIDDVYVHVDLDVLDPALAPGVVDDPVPGGLSLADAERVVRGVCERFRIRAAAVTTFTPQLDQDDRTLHAAVGLAGLVAESAR